MYHFFSYWGRHRWEKILWMISHKIALILIKWRDGALFSSIYSLMSSSFFSVRVSSMGCSYQIDKYGNSFSVLTTPSNPLYMVSSTRYGNPFNLLATPNTHLYMVSSTGYDCCSDRKSFLSQCRSRFLCTWAQRWAVSGFAVDVPTQRQSFLL